MPVQFSSVAQIEAAVGQELGPGEWLEVDQKRIDLFAEATGDDQWIHVDPERAKDSPYGGTIAHGYLTASLIPLLLGSVFEFTNTKMGVNYGSDSIRFPSPVPSGSRLRARATVESVETGPKGTQIVVAIVLDSDVSQRPACVAVTRFLLVF